MLAVTPLTTSLPAKPFHNREFRIYRRRKRLKIIKASIPSPLPSSSPFENLFNTLINQNPSVNSLDFITPALGFTSGAALFFSRFKSRRDSSPSDVGEWIFFASPTPFNRFVLLRCPSISFQGSDDVSERLLTEEKHYVTVNSGRIQVNKSEKDLEKLSYQRVCVNAKDGGVVSLDWPSELDLEEERGLDSTLLLVPGTPQGSMDDNVRLFVIEALKRGFFPVVMNPRGCAASPLTTPRLFTAADSDDICTAITYINTARPWTTLMGVGWGYGANMLTKYLAEVGEKTPLTAATCIDNPFDLDEATRTSPYHIVTDQKLTGGLVDILQTNKVLFQGKTKGFDVEKALLAKSVRDFEEAISMVSYGYLDIEDFYTKSSTRNMIKDINIPVLFIHSDNGMVPAFSVPRNLIAENAFTSLLLCSCLPSSVTDADTSALSWCHLLTIEWLAAVELGLLKGRHPLLTDIDVTINPSKGLTVMEEVRPDKSPKMGKLLELTQSDVYNGYSIDPTKYLLEESENGSSLQSRSQHDLQRKFEQEDMSLQVKISPLQQTSAGGDSIEEENVASGGSEQGHVLQTAQVVINMLDVTMPGTLTEEKKKKVLTAVGQGETLKKALEDAVPEDVRGKLKDAMAGIMQAHGSDLKFDKILSVARAPNSSSGQKDQETSSGLSSAEVMSGDQSSSNQMKNTSSTVDGADNVPNGMGDSTKGTETEVLPAEKSSNSTNSAQSQESNNEVGSSGEETSESIREETGEFRDNSNKNDELKGKAVPDMDNGEKELEPGSKSDTPSHSDGVGVSEAAADTVTEQKSQNSGVAKTDTEENNISKVDQKSQHLSGDQSKTSTNTKEEPPSPPMSSEHQTVEKDGSGNENKDIKNTQPISPQTNVTSSDPIAPGFSVSQALGALTGMDDSTQMAVNSVYGVIENMLTQLEESSDNEDELKDGKDVDLKLEEQQKKNSQSNDSNTSGNPSVDDHHDGMSLKNDSSHTEEQLTQSLGTINGRGISNSQNCYSNDHPVKKAGDSNSQLIDKRNLVDECDRHKHVNNLPDSIAAGSYGDSPNNKYLPKDPVSTIPTKSLDSDPTSLLVDYFPEDEWKISEQPQNMEIASANTETYKLKNRSSAKSFDAKQYIEPPYVILDAEEQQEPIDEFITTDTEDIMTHTGDDGSEESIQFVKNRVLDSLKTEVGRKLNAAEMIEMKSKLAGDMEHVAIAVSLATVNTKGRLLYSESQGYPVESTIGKVGTLDGEHIIRVISSSVQQTSYLRKVMPVGVIVGSILAVLRKYFNIATRQKNGQGDPHDDAEKPGKKNCRIVDVTEADQVPEEKNSLDRPIKGVIVENEPEDARNNNVMVGAVTAAIGASAILMQQKGSEGGNEAAASSTTSLNMKGRQKNTAELEGEVFENQSNMITSLAEKAMSVASPVVPTKEDGGVDQDRLVGMLADLGQRGGLLRLVGKFALLWGGIRSAMSLTDKLISFSHMAERPLYQRILGFVGMILVLWSPVVIPLLPTIVQGWTTSTTSKIAVFACIIGLYIAIMILVMIWGKRIRGYENSFGHYGLDFASSQKLIDFFKGLAGGVVFIFSIHAVNAFLGFASFSWPLTRPSLNAMTWLKVYGQMGLLVIQGTLMATAISLVEELLFRSWLPQEIAVDLGYYHGIIISGLAFSVLQRSLQAIPGLWLLSMCLSGARQRNEGSLAIPVGLRTGMLASTSILQKGGFLTYNITGNFSHWIVGSHPFQPLSGLVGLGFSLMLAMIFYPRQTSQKKEAQE